jgi:5-methylcytosine-specific restriction endonuclease McrA
MLYYTLVMPQRIGTYSAKVKRRKPKIKPFYARASSHQRGYTHKWRKLRLMKLANNPVCEICELRCATDVHHVNKVSDGHPVLCHLDDLRSLCHTCHSELTAKGL